MRDTCFAMDFCYIVVRAQMPSTNPITKSSATNLIVTTFIPFLFSGDRHSLKENPLLAKEGALAFVSFSNRMSRLVDIHY